MTPINRRQALAAGAGAFLSVSTASAKRRDAMRALTPSQITTVDEHPDWYMHSAGVAVVGNELVCTYRKSDEHMASVVDIWCARSKDGGRTWTDHKLISPSSWEKDKAAWVAPQLTQLRNGDLLLIVDKGNKKFKQDWPMLSQWQMADRGMQNYLFVSKDGGRTWQGPRKIDDVGGEPGYIVELSNGDLMYTRTDSKPTDAIKVPPMPWGPNYYRSTAVFSSDKGQTWNRTSAIADDPFGGDCEVGVVELTPGHLLAISRIGHGGGNLGQPSRFIYSSDYGRTWGKPQISPLYAQRAIVRKLASGKLLVTYRNAWGTPATYAFLWDPSEKLVYHPNSFIWDENCCQMRDGAMEVTTSEGREKAVEFVLYPVEDDDSAVEMEAEVMVKSTDRNGVSLSAGSVIRLLPNRIELADRPAVGFALDTTKWHNYRIVNRGRKITVYVDGVEKLSASNEGIFNRLVRFGNRRSARSGSGNIDSQTASDVTATSRPKPLRGLNYTENASQSMWRAVSAKVTNRRDHSIDWRWNARDGYPDQFRRDRMILLEKAGSFSGGDCGYGGWAQLKDGSVALLDYNIGTPPAPRPRLRCYRFSEKDFHS